MAMEDVIRNPLGTAYNMINLGDMPVAGKTGTTDSAKDIWFEGYTPYYTCGVWGGYDNNDALPDSDVSYSRYAKVLWNAIMTRIHSELPVTDFVQPEGITTAQICKKSGKLAVAGLCDNDPRGSQVMTEYFKEGTVPTESCDVHVSAKICNQTGKLASSTCPSTTTKVYVRRPDGSTGTTDDSNYAAPTETCPGHGPAIKIEGSTENSSETEKKADSQDGVIDIGGSTSFEDIPSDEYYDNGIIRIY